MKIEKKFRLFCGMLAALLFASCTLVMDDLPAESDVKAYAEDIETVGFDEPYTQETEYGDITFQYGDSTNVLKKAAFDYLIKVDGDSILYFTDNIPSELLVRPGYYVSMGCSRILPQGLCSKVLSLVHEPGMYKMVTTRVAQEEVFDQYNLDLNVDYKTMVSSIEIDNETEIVESDSTAELAAYDFSAIDGEQTRSVTRGTPIDYSSCISGTRGYVGDGEGGEGGEEKEETWTDRDQDVDKSTDEFSDQTIPFFSISTGDAGGDFSKKISGWLMSKSKLGTFLKKLKATGLNAGLSVSYNSKKHINVKTVLDPDPKKTVREQTVEDHSKFIIDLDITKSGDAGTKNHKPEEVYKQVEGVLRTGKDYDEEMSLAVRLGIPIPAAPAVMVFVRISPHFNVEVGAVGRLECSYVCPTTVTYSKTIGNEDVTPADKKQPTKKSDGGFTYEKCSLFGYLKFSGGVEVLLGVGAGKSGLDLEMAGKASYFTGIGIGADFTMALTINVGVNSHGSFTDETYINFNISLQLLLRMFFYRWNTKIGLASWPLYDRNWYMMPTYGDCSLNVSHDGDGYALCEAKMSYAGIGIIGHMYSSRFNPVLRLYYKATDGTEKTLDMDLAYVYKKFTTGTYVFRETLSDAKGSFYVIPGYSYMGDKKLFEDKKIEPSIHGEPYLRSEGLYLTDILGAWDFVKSSDADEYNHYTFVAREHLYNAEYMKGKWSNWGIHVNMSEYNPKTDHYEEFLDKYIKVKVDNKNGCYNVKFKFKTTSDQKYLILVAPCYWDSKGDVRIIETERGAGEYWESIWFGPESTDLIKSAPTDGFKKSVIL